MHILARAGQGRAAELGLEDQTFLLPHGDGPAEVAEVAEVLSRDAGPVRMRGEAHTSSAPLSRIPQGWAPGEGVRAGRYQQHLPALSALDGGLILTAEGLKRARADEGRGWKGWSSQVCWRGR